MLTRPTNFADQKPFFRVANIDCPVEVRRSSRAKRFSLKVSHTERSAILTLPSRGCVEDASAFLARHADWLTRQIERLPEPIPFEHGANVPLRGLFYALNFVGTVRHRGVVWVDGLARDPAQEAVEWCRGTQKASVAQLCVNGDRDYAARRFSDWLRAEVRKDLTASVEHHAKNLNCTPKRISIRDQATRWGSCSTTGTLSFSWRLIFAPPFVLDYVAAHEVAHLREMNHGPRFWRLVRETCPEMQKARAWLKANGSELHRFGALN